MSRVVRLSSPANSPEGHSFLPAVAKQVSASIQRVEISGDVARLLVIQADISHAIILSGVLRKTPAT